MLSVCLRRAWDAEAEVAAAAATTGSAAAMLFAGLLGGSGGRLLGVTGSAGTRGVTMGEKGALRKVEMSCMSRAGVASTTGSSAVTLRRAERGFSSGAKRPLCVC